MTSTPGCVYGCQDERWGKTVAMAHYMWQLCERWVISEIYCWDHWAFPIPTLMLWEWRFPRRLFSLLLVPLDFCKPAVDMVVVFFCFSLETVWRQTADLFFCGEFGSRLGTGIRSTQKPQRHVSRTHTHTHTHSLGVPAFVENCFSIHSLYHFLLAVAACVCVYPGLDSEKIFI